MPPDVALDVLLARLGGAREPFAEILRDPQVVARPLRERRLIESRDAQGRVCAPSSETNRARIAATASRMAAGSGSGGAYRSTSDRITRRLISRSSDAAITSAGESVATSPNSHGHAHVREGDHPPFHGGKHPVEQIVPAAGRRGCD